MKLKSLSRFTLLDVVELKIVPSSVLHVLITSLIFSQLKQTVASSANRTGKNIMEMFGKSFTCSKKILVDQDGYPEERLL